MWICGGDGGGDGDSNGTAVGDCWTGSDIDTPVPLEASEAATRGLMVWPCASACATC